MKYLVVALLAAATPAFAGKIEFVKKVAATSMDYSLARACATGVEAELAKTATKS